MDKTATFIGASKNGYPLFRGKKGKRVRLPKEYDLTPFDTAAAHVRRDPTDPKKVVPLTASDLEDPFVKMILNPALPAPHDPGALRRPRDFEPPPFVETPGRPVRF